MNEVLGTLIDAAFRDGGIPTDVDDIASSPLWRSLFELLGCASIKKYKLTVKVLKAINELEDIDGMDDPFYPILKDSMCSELEQLARDDAGIDISSMNYNQKCVMLSEAIEAITVLFSETTTMTPTQLYSVLQVSQSKQSEWLNQIRQPRNYINRSIDNMLDLNFWTYIYLVRSSKKE